ncbi:MAG: tRNA pseudouridine(38-40) synthase TruA [Lachnospiraceae bacterium]|nr:tRNA pseudouridine(38-40) synthase TruA [Lachnospiraceae bacterium]
MPNYKMIIQYEGTKYKGWQEQKNTDATIQGRLQRILERMSKEEIDLQGSGRTDAGVHARAQVAHFHMRAFGDTEKMKAYVNEYLPEDIAVLKVELADDRFHARLNAKSKTYEYRIFKGDKPDVFDRRYVFPIGEKLDVGSMRQAAKYLEGTHDFKAFCGNRRMKKSTVRTIVKIEIEEIEREIRLRFTGNGFLQNMVRILVGTLVEVGRGERNVEEMTEIIESRDRQRAGALMPAKGLTLMEVKYR